MVLHLDAIYVPAGPDQPSIYLLTLYNLSRLNYLCCVLCASHMHSKLAIILSCSCIVGTIVIVRYNVQYSTCYKPMGDPLSSALNRVGL